MDFPMVDEKNGRYAHVYPTSAQNEELRQVAHDLGDRGMVAWRGKGEEAHWRLYENRVPAGADVDAKFAKFTTPEAQAAFSEERSAKLAGVAAVERVTPKREEISEDRKYYPITGKERDDFNAVKDAYAKAGTPVDMPYDMKAKAFVHKSGPTEGFEKWQTPEAKAAWESRGAVRERGNAEQVERTGVVAQQVDLRAQGKLFEADHVAGLLLPGPKRAEERAGVLEAMKKASPEEIVAVSRATETEMRALEKKQYAIQLGAAEKAGTSKTDFDAADSSKRRELAQYQGLSNGEFAKLVGLTSGHFALRDERRDRGMEMSTDQARAKKEAVAEVEKPKAVDEKAKERKPEQAKTGGRASSRGAAAAADLARSMGR